MQYISAVYPNMAAIPEAIDGFGMLQATEYFGITGKTMTFNFIHSIQEFLAAYHT